MNEIAVVWVALGTPAQPTPPAVRQYLRQFLTDRRIIEMNPIAWRAILELFILPKRGVASAEKYAGIWTPDGSPLLVHTKNQAQGIAERLEGVTVTYAMRYGEPNLGSVLDRLAAEGVSKVLIVPAYPQYSQTTVGSIYDAVARHILASRNQLEYRFIRSVPTHPGYIDALATTIERRWVTTGRPDFAAGETLLLSYHSIPVAMVDAGDPYVTECQATTTALAARLGLDEQQCRTTYQSKFGPAAWLTPATIDTVAELARSDIRRLDIACPGFVADCLETLEELDLLNQETYLSTLPESAHPTALFNRVPCLNDDPLFLDALTNIIRTGIVGWLP
ncbi:MAG: ferrochelatase [Propionibacteriaceae bacterium]|nr:ferrochelatase [Propionibacteriaceae bacterium]